MTGAGRATGRGDCSFAGSAMPLPGSMSADAVMISKRAHCVLRLNLSARLSQTRFRRVIANA